MYNCWRHLLRKFLLVKLLGDSGLPEVVMLGSLVLISSTYEPSPSCISEQVFHSLCRFFWKKKEFLMVIAYEVLVWMAADQWRLMTRQSFSCLNTLFKDRKYMGQRMSFWCLSHMRKSLLYIPVQWFWVFIYIHTLCLWAAKALASLHICAGSPEHSKLTDGISTKM